jgi:hypothetical protein
MSSFSNQASGAAMLSTLNTITSMYTDKYLTLGSSQGIYTAQKKKLEATLNSIQKQINAKNDSVNTYDRELQDRMAVSSPYNFWRTHGLSTLQDWVLFTFFFIYLLISLFLLMLGLRSQYPLYAFLTVLLSSFGLGVVLVGIIVRFA